ncbi:MAG TPA: DsbA family protein [Bryobacteraceae bacterium]|nr:DsbA family protein [Bryobacteraceae bacterium]
MKFALLLALALPAFAQTKLGGTRPAGATPFDKASFENYIRHIELYAGPVTMKIDDPKPSKYLPDFSEIGVHLTYNGGHKDELYYLSPDGILVHGDVYNMHGNPFQSNLDKLNVKGAPSFGAEHPEVTIVEFGDLECPDCKMEAPALREDVSKAFPGKVRVYFKDFPLESIHPWARAAAIAGRCVYRQNGDSFWKFYDWIYDNQDQIDPDNLNAKIMSWAATAKDIDTVQLGRCIGTKATEPEVNRNIAEGRALGVNGTPTLFINGRKIGGLQSPVLQQVIDIELKYQATHPSR